MVTHSLSAHATIICDFKHLLITTLPLSHASEVMRPSYRSRGIQRPFRSHIHTIHHNNSQLRTLRNEHNKPGLTDRSFLHRKSMVELAVARL
ncbi:hypothetical protein VNO77_03111 [Canavalia gladiata]|uniref:Uncharacterized protein n=1 Tax=Canavalia gladiata TaxID=3824 RepID=A0AAN9MU68_CANGL